MTEGAASGGGNLRRQVEGFANDHIGLAHDMKKAANFLRMLGGESGPVLAGRDGWLYLRSAKSDSRATGIFVDGALVERWRGVAAELGARQTAHGGRFLFIAPPDKETIYPEYLPPDRVPAPGVRDSLDVLLEELDRDGIPHVDLRVALRAAKGRGLLYSPTDTHWNTLGAAVAFNAAMAELGETGAALDIDARLKGFASQSVVRDLQRMMGRDWAVAEQVPVFGGRPFSLDGAVVEDVAPAAGHEGQGGTIATRSGAGPRNPARPRVLVVGDSFTQHRFPPLLLRGFPSVMWLHHHNGDFDRALVEAFDPDIVILAVVERLLG